MAMVVQVLNPVNAPVHVAVGLGFPEVPVPLDVPKVPVVPGIGLGHLEFDVLISLADDHALTGFECFAAACRGDLGPSLPHGDSHAVETNDFHSVASVLFRTNRGQWGLNINVSIAAPQFAVSEYAALKLNPEGSVAEAGQSDLGQFVKAQKVGVIQLDFGTGGQSGSQNIGLHQRHVDGGLNRISRFASLHREVALGQAEPGDTQRRTALLRLCQRQVIDRHGNEGKQHQNSTSTCHG